jgi:peptidoglycan/LPS O-acetylase OafA/YrhL
LNGIKIPVVHYEFYALFFGLIILNFAANPDIKISMENAAFSYLGNISYGLYMYHPIGIVLAISICKKVGLLSNWLIYPASMLLTVALAGLSYRYYESFFLQFKKQFSKIISG